jgi:hypothetical protein
MSGFLMILPNLKFQNSLGSIIMNRIFLTLVAIIGFNLYCWSQPDYSNMVFRTKIKEYKKNKPNLQGIEINKDQIKNLVFLLGSDFYNEDEIGNISEKVWLSFIDPERFDFVFKDIAIRTLPNINKKNIRGNIVVEPNPFLAQWTLAENENAYFQSAFSLILSYYNLMKYSDDAKSTKKALKKLLYTEKENFRPVYVNDWTKTYLKSANKVLSVKGLTILMANGKYNFFVCKENKKDEITSLFRKIDWEFSSP